MKTLTQHLDEKLIIFPSQVDEKLVINKNFKSSDILDEIKNTEWIKDQNAGKYTKNIGIFYTFVEYIRETNPKEISCATASRRVNKDKYLCGINIHKKIMVLYHKSDVEHDLYERIDIGLVSSSSETRTMFTHNVKMLKSAIAPLNTRSAFFASGKYYQYEISKETFDELANLYEEL